MIERIAPAQDIYDVSVGRGVTWFSFHNGWTYRATLFVVDGDPVMRVQGWEPDDGSMVLPPTVWYLPPETNLLRLIADGLDAEPQRKEQDDEPE